MEPGECKRQFSHSLLGESVYLSFYRFSVKTLELAGQLFLPKCPDRSTKSDNFIAHLALSREGRD